MLPSHGRYDYSAISCRKSFNWPNGGRLAVYLGVNLEHFSFAEGLGAELAPGGPRPDILNYAWRDYGNRVGAWRLIETLDSLKWPASVIANSAMVSYAPTLLAAHIERGDEIVGHGRTNSERQSVLCEADERALIIEATETLAGFCDGTAPSGWLSPWIAESMTTPDLLAEAGYQYTLNWCMDDQPIWMRSRGGRLLAIPYPQEINDIPSIIARKNDADVFAAMIIDNFDEMRQQAEYGPPLVMGIALHPYIIGQPYRLRHLRRALMHISQYQESVWITRAGNINEACRALPEGTIA